MSRTGEAPHPDPGAHGGGTSAPLPPRRRSRDKRATARLWGQIPGSRSPAGRGGLRGTETPAPGPPRSRTGPARGAELPQPSAGGTTTEGRWKPGQSPLLLGAAVSRVGNGEASPPDSPHPPLRSSFGDRRSLWH